jgi:hypothetical protein
MAHHYLLALKANLCGAGARSSCYSSLIHEMAEVLQFSRARRKGGRATPSRPLRPRATLVGWHPLLQRPQVSRQISSRGRLSKATRLLCKTCNGLQQRAETNQRQSKVSVRVTPLLFLDRFSRLLRA